MPWHNAPRSALTFSVLTPKNRRSATAQYSPTGRLLLRLSGSLVNRRPRATLMPVIRARAATAPAMTTALPRFMASRAAMKNVLSPISLTKMRPNAAVKPCTGDVAVQALSALCGQGSGHRRPAERPCAFTHAPTLRARL